MLGKDSNALVWPRGPPDEEDDEDGMENYKNLRFMRLGAVLIQFSWSVGPTHTRILYSQGMMLLTSISLTLDRCPPKAIQNRPQMKTKEHFLCQTQVELPSH